ncbi:MAG: tyrosinase family protein [Gammaproteobacteria bacterium]
MDIRKNAAALTAEEWQRLINAFVTLKHTFPAGSNVSIYDQFVAIHQGVTQLTGAQTVDGGHGGPAFLPWHREYLKRFEQALQSVDPRVTVPYWNWGLGPESDTSSLFRDDRMGPMGSGGASGFEIASGFLALTPNSVNPLGWSVHPSLRAFGQALQRNRVLDTASNQPAPWPTAQAIDDLLGLSSFHDFRPGFEFPPHGIVHIRVGRDMARMTSPNDPIFWLHHAQVDRIWSQWQASHPGPSNYNPRGAGGQGHRLDDPMWPWDAGASQSIATNIGPLLPRFPITDVARPVDVLDHHSLGYLYDDEPGARPGAGNGSGTQPSAVRESIAPNLSIPDAVPEGVTSTLNVAATGNLVDISVDVDITHTWRGDLRVNLTTPGGVVAQLHRNDGGGEQNLIRSFRPGNTPDLASLVQGSIPAAGAWILHVADSVRRDVGRLNSWAVDLRLS